MAVSGLTIPALEKIKRGLISLDPESYRWPDWLWTLLLSASGALAAIAWVVLGTLMAPAHRRIVRWLLFASGSATAVWLLYSLFLIDMLQTAIVLGATVAAGCSSAILFAVQDPTSAALACGKNRQAPA